MPEFPQLAFLPVQQLLIHERHDDTRTKPLVLRIRASGVLRNPPVVAPLQDGSQRYMVLDGANRITALREMNFPHALVQIVEPDDPGLGLQNWNHVIWEMNAQRFLTSIRNLPGLQLRRLHDTDSPPKLEGDCGLAIIQSCRGRKYMVCCRTSDLESRITLLNSIVDSYQERGRLDRTSVRDILPLRRIYPSLSGLVIFPQFHITDLLHVSGHGCLLPTGITRFTISPRALHLNYPLEELSADKPIEVKNEALQQWIRDRLANKGVRYYAEPTYLFDE
jgi:L-serine kinase (ATP) / ParB family transcriptional regulator, heme-responsive regulator